MISENVLITKKTGRYYSLGEGNIYTKNIWFVFHGYGQLAKEFIKEFEVLKNDGTLIVAPEALNKFYFRGFNGKIGASWMTKENRENEIKDYIDFISQVFHETTNKIDLSSITINVLGFSQGTHTAVRWLSKTKIQVDNLILWSGSFPRDCNYDNFEYWSKIKSKIVVGKKDRMIDEEKSKSEVDYFDHQGLEIKIIKFDGGHEIKKDLLKKISTSI